MNSDWTNRRILIADNELIKGGIEGTIIGVGESSVSLKLSKPVQLPNGQESNHLVASVRHENKSLNDILSGEPVLCALTLVPFGQFDHLSPCDVSWWRGGGAVIGDVCAMN